MKFLVVRFSSIGDIVLTTPVVRCLRRKFPDAEIHYATKSAYADILKHNPYINQLHLLGNEPAVAFADKLKGERFDFVIDLHHNQRTWVIKKKLGVPSAAFNKLNFEKWLLVNTGINKLPDVHIVDRYMETCLDLGVQNDGEGLDYFIGADDIVDLRTLPDGFRTGYIAWVIGAKQNTKKLPVEKVAAALQHLRYPVVLLGGKEDAAAGAAIQQQANATVPVYNACGLFSLNQSVSLVRQSRVVVTNDTGLMHVAAACRKPVLSVWGNTIPQLGMYPYYGKRQVTNYMFEVNGLKCRPCSKLGYETCPKGHFNCMNYQSEVLIANEANRLFTLV